MRTVLVIDDYEGVRAALAFVLPPHGFRVVTADSGRRALELAPHETIDVVLLDVIMPGMDGFQTCTALLAQARSRGQDVPIWMTSAAANSGAEKRAREVGALGPCSESLSMPPNLRPNLIAGRLRRRQHRHIYRCQISCPIGSGPRKQPIPNIL